MIKFLFPSVQACTQGSSVHVWPADTLEVSGDFFGKSEPSARARKTQMKKGSSGASQHLGAPFVPLHLLDVIFKVRLCGGPPYVGQCGEKNVRQDNVLFLEKIKYIPYNFVFAFAFVWKTS